jgi:3-oxoacyl-[acyl-carrier-protein] synthase II
MNDAGLTPGSFDATRFGCIVGSGIGGVEWFENNCNSFTAAGGGYSSLRSVDPFLIPALIANTASGMIAIQHGMKGPNYCVTTACATGTHSIGSALKHLRDGEGKKPSIVCLFNFFFIVFMMISTMICYC